MRVMLLEDDERFRLKKGDIFKAVRYRYDPEKMSLLERESDGFDPQCNQYCDSLAYEIQGRWHVLEGSQYVEMENQ